MATQPSSGRRGGALAELRKLQRPLESISLPPPGFIQEVTGLEKGRNSPKPFIHPPPVASLIDAEPGGCLGDSGSPGSLFSVLEASQWETYNNCHSRP